MLGENIPGYMDIVNAAQLLFEHTFVCSFLQNRYAKFKNYTFKHKIFNCIYKKGS